MKKFEKNDDLKQLSAYLDLLIDKVKNIHVHYTEIEKEIKQLNDLLKSNDSSNPSRISKINGN
jgi:cell division septum initiation protein DivIVA